MNTRSKGLSDDYYTASGGYDNDDYYFDSEDSNKKDIAKVVIGALAGAALGSLIAGAFTEKGVEIRHRIGEKSKNAADNVKQKVSDIKDAVADKFETAREGAADLLKKGKQKIGLSGSNRNYEVNSAYAGNTAYTSEESENGTGKKILLGALIVSVAGAIVWSFATEKGKDTRKNIVEGSKNLASNIKEKATHVKEAIADTYEAAKQGANDLIAQEQQRQMLERQRAGVSPGNGTFTDVTGTQNL